MLIETRFSVGDSVFCASTTVERKQHPCPDCLGSRKWKATSPAGAEYEFACPRCAASYQSNRDISLDYSEHVPLVRPLTIGSVQVNTAPGSWDHGNRYMCRETGVGSGTVYNEDDLFGTEEGALEAAKLKAAEANKSSEWIVKLYNQTLSISDYQLDSATMKSANDEASRARSMLWNLGDLFGKIDESADKDEILEAVEDYKRFDWSRDKEKAAA